MENNEFYEKTKETTSTDTVERVISEKNDNIKTELNMIIPCKCSGMEWVKLKENIGTLN